MKKLFLMITATLFLLAGATAFAAKEGISQQLINPKATPEARQLYTALLSVYGEKAISGVVCNIDWNYKEAENVHEWTGKWPVINVFDFINIHASKDVNKQGWLDYSDMSPVFQWYEAGGVVGCMWHWQVKANDGVNLTCSPGTKLGETSFDAEKVMQPGTAEYKQALHDIDQIAGYLKTMQKKGIPVIWRPFHEAAGNIYEFEAEPGSGGAPKVLRYIRSCGATSTTDW